MKGRVTANLPSRDPAATAAFYARSGFAVGYRGADGMILDRGPLEIEFFPHPGLDPAASWLSACVRLDDLDALHAEWGRAGLATEAGAIPRITAPAPVAPDLRMFAVVDADGSLLRCLGR